MHAREKIWRSALAPLTPCGSLHHSTAPPKKRCPQESHVHSFVFLIPSLPSVSPHGRSKLLRWNNDHPSRNRSQGGRLHHLPLPQRRLVEAGAVLAAGVPQRPDVVVERLHRGWRERPGMALPTAPFCMIDRAGAQVLKEPERAESGRDALTSLTQTL